MSAPVNHDSYSDAYLQGVLESVRTIAVVGASDNPVRASYFVMKYMKDKGYTVIPINPGLAGREILGLTVMSSLKELLQPPDMVDIFRNSEAAAGVVDDAIAIGAKVVWLQLGVRNDGAARRAEEAGLTVVMDRCPKMEYQRLFGEIGRIGVNSNVITTKKRPVKAMKKLI